MQRFYNKKNPYLIGSAGRNMKKHFPLIVLVLVKPQSNREKYDYPIVSTAGNSDEKFAEFPTVFVVERDGVPFVYVKKPH
jgi:hypothetical protein